MTGKKITKADLRRLKNDLSKIHNYHTMGLGALQGGAVGGVSGAVVGGMIGGGLDIIADETIDVIDLERKQKKKRVKKEKKDECTIF